MRITKYNLMLNSCEQTVLIKESATNYRGEYLGTSSSAAEMLNEVFLLNKKAEEYLYLIAVNMKYKPIGVFEVSHGAVGYSCISPREIYIRALLVGAVSIIIAHNHPSGECTPSNCDIQATKDVLEAGKLIGIKLLDHIIVGNGYFSFGENNMLE